MTTASTHTPPIPIHYPGDLPLKVLPKIMTFRVLEKLAGENVNHPSWHTRLERIWKSIAENGTHDASSKKCFEGMPPLKITSDTRFALSSIEDLELELFDDMCLEAEKLISQIDVTKQMQEQEKTQKGKYYKIQLNGNMYLNPSDSIFTRFALQKKLLHIAHDYLKVPLRLHSTELHLDNPVKGDPVSSQFWHYDGLDFKLVKVFVYLRDVTAESGCLAVISTDTSQKLKARLAKDPKFSTRGNNRLELIDSLVDPSDIHPIHGPKGTVTVADTSMLLHRGMPQISKQRLMYVATYTSAVPTEEWPLSPFRKKYMRLYKELGLIH